MCVEICEEVCLKEEGVSGGLVMLLVGHNYLFVSRHLIAAAETMPLNCIFRGLQHDAI